MLKIRKHARKALSVLLSALLTASVLSTAAVFSVSAVTYSEMSALDQYAYSGNDLGANYTKTSTTFKVWAPTASAVKVKLYNTGSDSESGAGVVGTYSMTKGSSAVWSYTASGDLAGKYYTYLVTVNGSTKETVDIYAKTTGVNGLRGMVIDLDSTDPVGWESDNRIDCPNQTDAIIWEAHVRDFSSSSDSGMVNKGKYLAFTETGTTVNNDGVHPTGVDYLADLGVTHVHLLPVYDYGSVDETKLSTDQFNWGYDPMNYNTPEGSYSTDPYNGAVRVNEFKQMVQSLHKKGIGVVMDVVYNHTYAGDSNINDWFNYTVPGYYYRQNATGGFNNASGCGNETASDRAMYQKFMIDSLKYWATEYHLDGFRFDLMGIHDCDTMNAIRSALDEIDPQILIYGEPWTADSTTCPKATAVQSNMKLLDTDIGAFNDKVRDAIKGSCFNASDPGFIQGAGFEEALKGSIQANSTDMSGYNMWSKQPSQTVTYTSAHDNYTLYDKLVKSVKGGSGYGNRYEDLVAMNKLAGGIILTSQGTSFFQAGEEFARSKYGDENSYKSSTSVNQLKWSNTITYSDIVSYYKGLIEIRKAYSPFRDPTNTSNGTIYFSWGSNLPANVVAFTMYNNIKVGSEWDYVAVLHNANNYATQVTLLTYSNKTLPSQWVIIADGTSAGTKSLGTTSSIVTVPARSTMVLVDKTSFDNTVIEQKGTVTINHYDKTSGNLLKTETMSGKIGTSYSTSPASDLISNGYTVSSVTGSATGTYTSEGTTVSYYYNFDNSNYSSVQVNYYVGSSSGTLLGSDVYSGRNGTSYSFSAKSFEGYELNPSVSDSAVGVYGQGKTTYNFIYFVDEKQNLKIHYYNSNSWPNVAMYVYDESSGEVQMFSGAWPGTLMTSEGNGWYVGSVNTTKQVKFIANNNNAGSQDPTGVGSDGYNVQGEVWIQNGLVTSSGKVCVSYVNNTTGEVLATEIMRGKQGTSYSTSAKTYSGLDLVSTPSNATGVYGSSTVYVTYNYVSTKTPLSLIARLSTDTITLGEQVTLIGSASGGTSPYTYSYYFKPHSQSIWQTINPNGGTSVVYTPAAAGTYDLKIMVVDSDGSQKSEILSLTVEPGSSDLVNTSTINSEYLSVGQSVVYSGSAEGGTAPYKYAFYYKRASGKVWKVVGTEFGSTSAISFATTAADDYDIKITVKDATGATAEKTFSVTVSDGKSTAFENTSTISTTGGKVGTKVRVYASASGSSGYTYAFYYKRTTARLWHRQKTGEFSTTSAYQFTPTDEGVIDVRVDVKDRNNEIVSRHFTVTISSDYVDTSTVVNVSTNTSYAAAGTRIYVTANASGGTAPYTYAFYYKRLEGKSWNLIGTGFSSTNTASIKFSSPGEVVFMAQVRDANGGMTSQNTHVEIY